MNNGHVQESSKLGKKVNLGFTTTGKMQIFFDDPGNLFENLVEEWPDLEVTLGGHGHEAIIALEAQVEVRLFRVNCWVAKVCLVGNHDDGNLKNSSVN